MIPTGVLPDNVLHPSTNVFVEAGAFQAEASLGTVRVRRAAKKNAITRER